MANFLLALLALACTLAAATTSAAVSLNDTREYLVAHNRARAAVRVGPLEWSPNLALKASQMVQSQANQKGCNFANLSSGKYYGVNQLRVTGPFMCTPPAVVDQWVEEKKNYDYKTKSCTPNEQCGSYLQVVSRNSVLLGCAQVTCTENSGCLAICLYNPPAAKYVG